MPFYLADTKNKTNKKFQKIKKISPPLQKISKSDSPAPNGDFQKPGRRVAFRTLQKGSLVVEAAWSVPLFFLTVLALVSLMDIYGIYVAQMVQIQEEVEKIGMYAAAGEEDQTIDRSRTVAYHPLGLPFTVPGVQITCRGRVRAWSGRSQELAGEEEQQSGNRLVYVTDYESVYHTTSRCSHLSLTIRQIAFTQAAALRTKNGDRYQACEKCVGKGEVNPLVYITDQGDCYHNSLECSGLKRRVQLVSLSSVDQLECCSRCAQLEGVS